MNVSPSTKVSLQKTINKFRKDGFALFILAFNQFPTADEDRVEVISSDPQDRATVQRLANEALTLAATPPAIQIVN